MTVSDDTSNVSGDDDTSVSAPEAEAERHIDRGGQQLALESRDVPLTSRSLQATRAASAPVLGSDFGRLVVAPMRILGSAHGP